MGLYVDTSPKKQYYGLNNLDEKLERFVDKDDGFFVELGANNGVDQSNTLYFEKFRNWRGVLVEPTLHNYLVCKANRSKITKIFCNACTSFSYQEKFVEIIYSNLMSTPIGLESDIGDPLQHAQEGRRFLLKHEENVSFGAVARPLSFILDEADAPAVIDLLSLDVEGAEIEVLNGIDHDKYKFRYMCVESRSFERLNTLLVNVGYQFIEKLTVHDYLFALLKV